MRWHSTPESVRNGEITGLAIIECIFSLALYVGIGVYFHTFKSLAWALAVAPLMLLRSSRSVDWGLTKLAEVMEQQLGVKAQHRSRKNLLLAVSQFLKVIFIAAGIRIVAPFYWLVREPLQLLKEMPQNWVRQSLCVDVFHFPEIVPGFEDRGPRKLAIFRFSGLLEALKNLWKRERLLRTEFPDARGELGFTLFMIGFATLMIAPFVIVVVLLGFIPPLLYRASFKATAVAYMPFVWVARSTLQNQLSVTSRLERITKGELEKVRRLVSWPILTATAAKIALRYKWVDEKTVRDKFAWLTSVDVVAVLQSWPWWQWTLISDAALTFFLLFFADAALPHVGDKPIWSPTAVLNTVSTTSFVRAALAVVTMSHFFYVALLYILPPSARHLISG